MHFLIDADSAIYKAGCANETRTWYVYEGDNVVADFMYKADAKEFAEEQGISPDLLSFEQDKEAGPVGHSLKNVDNIINRIIKHERCTSYTVYISGSENFRYDICADYKGQRDKSNKPIHEQQIRNHLIKKWKAQVVDCGHETDDEVSIELWENPETHCIATIDKDLDNTPGWHFNFDKETYYYVPYDEASLHFYRQLLSGDNVDNIKGVKGIGKGRAEDLLPYPLTDERMCDIVWNVYKEKGYDYEYFLQQGRLLWMLRERGVMWEPPMTMRAFNLIDEEEGNE